MDAETLNNMKVCGCGGGKGGRCGVRDALCAVPRGGGSSQACLCVGEACVGREGQALGDMLRLASSYVKST